MVNARHVAIAATNGAVPKMTTPAADVAEQARQAYRQSQAAGAPMSGRMLGARGSPSPSDGAVNGSRRSARRTR